MAQDSASENQQPRQPRTAEQVPQVATKLSQKTPERLEIDHGESNDKHELTAEHVVHLK